LRARLGVRSRRANDPTYRRPLYNAIRRLQHEANLKPNGIIDHRTLALLNGPTHAQVIDTVLANMERWRWLPRDLGKKYVMVNIPDYTLKVVKDGEVAWRTKIVAGKPQTPTPLLTASMDNVIVNPSWYVPQSIIQNELLPLYDKDPKIFERMGLEVRRGQDGHINVVQPPGAANALGRIRFNFPNKFLVYQHDTPDKHLFAREVRDYSHGCMRVQDPDKYAEVLLGLSQPQEGYTAERIRKMYGTGEHDIHLKNPIPVHITYQTAYVNDDGKLIIRDDVYGRDARYFALMKGDERKVADVATETRSGTVVRPAKLPDGLFASSGGSGSGLFGFLFGGDRQRPEAAQQPRPRAQVPQSQQQRTQYQSRQSTYR